MCDKNLILSTFCKAIMSVTMSNLPYFNSLFPYTEMNGNQFAYICIDVEDQSKQMGFGISFRHIM